MTEITQDTQQRLIINTLDGQEFYGDVIDINKSGLFKVQWLKIRDLETGNMISINLDHVIAITEEGEKEIQS